MWVEQTKLNTLIILRVHEQIIYLQVVIKDWGRLPISSASSLWLGPSLILKDGRGRRFRELILWSLSPLLATPEFLSSPLRHVHTQALQFTCKVDLPIHVIMTNSQITWYLNLWTTINILITHRTRKYN